MALSSSPNDRLRLERRSNPVVIPGLIALILIVAAIAIALRTKPAKPQEVPATTSSNPFADMPPEPATPPKEHKGGEH